MDEIKYLDHQIAEAARQVFNATDKQVAELMVALEDIAKKDENPYG